MKKQYIVLMLAFVLLLTSCSTNNDTGATEQPKELTISAAASLTDAMDELKEIYEAEHNVELTFNFAGSGKLAHQIQQGAPVDVFISANENWLDTLLEEGLIDADSTTDVTGNKLVLIAEKDTTLAYDSFSDINVKELSNIAVGKPESVPAGEYTKKALEAIDKWEEIEPYIVYAKDVRQVLTYVETGNAEIGFVYESDALSSDKVEILTESNPNEHDPIIYPGGVTMETEQEEVAEDFLAFMTSDEAQEILETYGFTK
ncbi:MAG TPA: molybdate ABC transporter substrate-binding protein [Pseudogracilibacillus sp.]|nr:molybdate ABC transporter substrate-binding protein [Pseudogracilibacillus sp.]